MEQWNSGILGMKTGRWADFNF